MRLLGIETSSRRGSVALVQDDRVIALRHHEAPSAHRENMLRLVQQALGDAGWERSALDRVAVGVGPGSFTGLRVGVALAQGIALGLGIPLVGIDSLRAMAAAAPQDRPGARWALVDAHRNEVFVAAFSEEGAVLCPVQAVARAAVAAMIEGHGSGPRLVLGEIAAEVAPGPEVLRGFETDLPMASQVALLGRVAPAPTTPVEPMYARPADAIVPDLPPSPLAAPLDNPGGVR